MERKFSEFSESYKSLKHELGSIYDLRPAGTVVASWSLPQEVAGSNRFDDILITEFSESI